MSWTTRPPLLRLLLPAAQAPRLLRKLAERFVSGATVYPEYEGAARAVAERFLWDRPEDPLPPSP